MLSSEALRRIEDELPCRSQAIHTIDALLTLDESIDAELSSSRVPHFLVTGAHGSGKTSLLKAMLASSFTERDYAYIDCTKYITTRSLYEYTLDQIDFGPILTIDELGNVTSEAHSVDTLDSFLRYLTRVLMRPEQKNKILVFDHISVSSYDNTTSIIRALMALSESLPTNIVMVFVLSNRHEFPSLCAPTVHLEPYTNDEMVQIIQTSTPVNVDLEEMNISDESELKILWERFCKTFHSAFHETIGQDVSLYRSIAQKIFPQYLQPIKDDILSASNHVQLARSAQSLLMPERWILEEESASSTDLVTTDRLRLNELSLSSRYLLIASFLASYNPGKTDRTFFSRGRGEKTRKRAAGKAAANKVTKLPQRLLGPKGFTLERMCSIYGAILLSSTGAAAPPRHSAILDQQLATLASLRLISKLGGGASGSSGDLLDDGKWIVNLSFDVILRIAQSVKFEITRFLLSD